MKIQFIGTGGAFDVALGNSAALVDCEGTRFLIDCGHSVFPKLMERDVIDSIDAVLITHLHDDHVGSLSTLIFYHYLILKKGRMKIVVPHQRLKRELCDFLAHSQQEPEERVEFVPLSDYPQLGAIDTYGQHVPEMQTWGYTFREGEEKVVYSGDNGNTEAFFKVVEGREMEGALVFHEVTFWPGIFAHAYYKELEVYMDRYRIYGYHCDPKYAPEDLRVPLVVNGVESRVGCACEVWR